MTARSSRTKFYTCGLQSLRQQGASAPRKHTTVDCDPGRSGVLLPPENRYKGPGTCRAIAEGAGGFSPLKRCPEGRAFRPGSKLGRCRCCRDSCRMLGNQLGHDRRKLRAHALPVADPLLLQVDRGWAGAGIVGAHHFDGTAIAGAVLLNDNDTIIGLLAGAKARQTNHDHGDSVPFRFRCFSCRLGLSAWLVPEARQQPRRKPAKRKARQFVRPAQDSTPKYR